MRGIHPLIALYLAMTDMMTPKSYIYQEPPRSEDCKNMLMNKAQEKRERKRHALIAKREDSK